MEKKDEKFFYMNLKKRVSKNGKTFYTGKYSYAIDIIAFEKKDGSGDLTCWLQPKDMDELKNKGYGAQPQHQGQYAQPSAQQQYQPAPLAQPYPPRQQAPSPPPAPHQDQAPWPDDDLGF